MKRLELRPGFILFVCVLFYLCPAAVFWPFMALSVLHELGHLAALAVFGVEMRQIRLGVFGAVMQTEPMAHLPEAICALAGPAVNLFCFWALRKGVPPAAMLSLLLGCYNLLPIVPFDGGRALRALLSLCLPLAYVDAFMNVAGALTVLTLGLLCLLASRWFGRAPLLFFFMLLVRIAWERKFMLRT